jgi:hypothetical protein
VLLGAPLAAGCGDTSNGNDSAEMARKDAMVIAEGRQWAQKFYESDTEALWNQFGPQSLSRMKSKKDLDDFRDYVDGEYGSEIQVFDERVERQSPYAAVYVRPAMFEHSGTRLAMRIGFDELGKIALLTVWFEGPQKEAPTSHLEYTTRTAMRLPFDGSWYVLWGGRTIGQNQHTAFRDGRFAYDFVAMEDDEVYRTNGKQNADFFGFGRPVLAPGAGTIAAVVDGIEDNRPGTVSDVGFGAGLLGNHVIIDHGQSEFSFLVHLKNGSTRVMVGARVEAGDPVGLCGNSGASAGPHLHYQLQNTAVFAHGDGLPIQFRNYTSNGRFVESGEPIRQEYIVNGH